MFVAIRELGLRLFPQRACLTASRRFGMVDKRCVFVFVFGGQCLFSVVFVPQPI